MKICRSKKSPVNQQPFSPWVLFLEQEHLDASTWLDHDTGISINIKAYTDLIDFRRGEVLFDRNISYFNPQNVRGQKAFYAEAYVITCVNKHTSLIPALCYFVRNKDWLNWLI